LQLIKTLVLCPESISVAVLSHWPDIID